MNRFSYLAGAALMVAVNAASARPMTAMYYEEVGGDQDVTVRSVERSQKKVVSWLGVAVTDPTDALDAQLGLKEGQGLVVTMVASNSPAQKADLRKNDVLAQFDDQMLVDTMQLRKLVQMHAEGDTVKIVLYRGGKKQEVAAQLGKMAWDVTELEPSDAMHQVKMELKDIGDTTRGAIDGELHRAMTERQHAMDDAHRAMEEAKRAMEQAVRSFHRSHEHLGATGSDMDAMAESGVDLGNDATIVVKKDMDSAKSIVKTDESGDYVIVADPKKRLTAHGRDGKLLFDGEIETPEEQGKVPKEVWEKVKPMLDQMGPVKTEKPQTKADETNTNS